MYKQINAPFGQLGMDSLKVSTAALASNTANDALYTALEGKIARWTARRDLIATEMMVMLDGAAFDEEHINENRARQLIIRAEALLKESAGAPLIQ
jgi:hypothetical protein